MRVLENEIATVWIIKIITVYEDTHE